jgi:hypothetical protein
MNPCPNCVNEGCDALDALVCDELLAAASAKVDRTVIEYHKKLDGSVPFTDFGAMVPEATKDAP